MSHPNLDSAPPVAATLGKLRWHIATIRETPERYESKSLAELRNAAMELAKVTDAELNARAKL